MRRAGTYFKVFLAIQHLVDITNRVLFTLRNCGGQIRPFLFSLISENIC